MRKHRYLFGNLLVYGGGNPSTSICRWLCHSADEVGCGLKHKFLLLAAGFLVAAFLSAGEQKTLPTPARRIVSLAPHLVELLYAVGAGDYLVGVVDHGDYPPEARRLPSVGGAGRVDLERILALRCDLVVAWGSGTPMTQIEQLRRLGLTVYVSEPRTLADIALELERLGRLVGKEDTATAAAANFRARLAELQTRYANQPPVTVFYQVWDHPLVSVGAGHLISRVMELCGGRNILDADRGLAPIINREAVLAANPDVIIASGADAHRPAWLDDWRAWPRLAAVAYDNLFDIPPDLIQRHTPRLLRGAELLCADLEIARNKR
ncbi:iron complex transport system substrate-binding protein [Gammaproteobacteria bacterium]